MVTLPDIFRWLTDTALASGLLMLLGAAVLLVVREPARRQRVGECVLAACLLAAVVAASPGGPRWRVGLLESPALPAVRGFADLYGVDHVGGEATVAAEAPHAAPGEAPRDAVMWRVNWPAVIAAAYALLVTAGVVRILAAHGRLRRMAVRGAPPERELASLWGEMTAGLRRPVVLRVSGEVGRPLTFGLWRPVVLIPPALATADAQEDARLILLHELVHIRRRDAQTWLLAAAVEVLFFYQPLYWHLRRQLRLAQEYVADAWAAAAAPSRADYAANLLRLARGEAPALPVLATGALRGPSDFYRRMQRLLGDETMPERACPWKWTLTVAALALTLAVGVGSLTVYAARQSDAVAAERAETRAVAYLLNQQEPSGGWLSEVGPAPTALVLKALLREGVPVQHPAFARGLAFLETMRHRNGGYYANTEPAYNTAIVLSLLAALEGEAYREREAAGRAFLARQARAERPAGGNDWYAAEGRARSPWSGAAERNAGDVLATYGQMSYGHLKSFVYAGLTKDDARVRLAARWIADNWTLQRNPGPGSAEGLYYYYHLLARTLAAQGRNVVTDRAGNPHDWRMELRGELLARQRADGSWINTESGRWLEDRGPLVTAYALLALQEARRVDE